MVITADEARERGLGAARALAIAVPFSILIWLTAMAVYVTWFWG
jgi:hypothetical protein